MLIKIRYPNICYGYDFLCINLMTEVMSLTEKIELKIQIRNLIDFNYS